MNDKIGMLAAMMHINHFNLQKSILPKQNYTHIPALVEDTMDQIASKRLKAFGWRESMVKLIKYRQKKVDITKNCGLYIKMFESHKF